MSQAGSSAGFAHIGLAGSSQTFDVVSVDALVAQIVGSDDPVALARFLKDIAPKDSRDNALVGMLSDRKDPLLVLDPEQHTLGYLHILSARFNSAVSPKPSREVIKEFCKRFNPGQARLAHQKVTALAKSIVRIAHDSGDDKFALGPLYNLLTRYPPSLACLTTLHPIFVTQCVATKYYTLALPVLAVPITTIDLKLSDLTYNDNLQYHYVGGVALGALKQWKKAEEFFEICASSPAQMPAAIQLEASKKLVLVQLILYGKTVPPPKYTNIALQRLLKSSPYGAFAKSYPQGKAQLLGSIQKDADLFNNEKHLGLIHQAIDRAPRWLIQKLTSTYLTLGLADIAKEVGIGSEEEVRSIVLSMIESDEINATISADGTVTFSDPVPQISKADVDLMLRQAQEQTRLLYELERTMNANKDYLTKAVKHKDEAGWGPDEDVYSTGGGSGWVEDSVM
ncbi:uncharacterized protein B0H18DRAFT_604297 [Fomitopsis serialis]|uniref:uncharacterized protein n=1 Tax=Fomitopsis serialis TaxID=139415 RepID=UPI0020081EBA|nr:uncharacterized protein B0H18DRAFT_604297 [Neoantrodia serialis]KAH9933879.1 hypothetical protein B0H18DRAFT_604297 [Neoantrodia serialis]